MNAMTIDSHINGRPVNYLGAGILPNGEVGSTMVMSGGHEFALSDGQDGEPSVRCGAVGMVNAGGVATDGVESIRVSHGGLLVAADAGNSVREICGKGGLHSGDIRIENAHNISHARNDLHATGGTSREPRYLITLSNAPHFVLRAVEHVRVELDRHAAILAEGVAWESFLDIGNPFGFASGGAAIALQTWFAAPLAPFRGIAAGP